MDKKRSRVLLPESLEEIRKPRKTRIELEKGNCFEEIGWMDESLVDGGDSQLVEQICKERREKSKRRSRRNPQ